LMTMVVGGGSGMLLVPLINTGPTHALPLWAKISLNATIISVPITLSLLLLRVVRGSAINLVDGVEQYGYVIVVAAVVTTGWWLLDPTSMGQKRVPRMIPLSVFLLVCR